MDVGFHFGRSFNFSFCLGYNREKSVAGMYFSKSGKESEGNSAAVEDLITAVTCYTNRSEYCFKVMNS